MYEHKELYVRSASDVEQICEGVETIRVTAEEEALEDALEALLTARLPRSLDFVELCNVSGQRACELARSFLSVLPEWLSKLSVVNCDLTELPALPAGLSKLYCANNLLASLPALPENLRDLWCVNRCAPMLELPPMPRGLRSLVFNYDYPHKTYIGGEWPYMRPRMPKEVASMLVPRVSDEAAELLRVGYFRPDARAHVLRVLLRAPNAMLRWHWLPGLLSELPEEEAATELAGVHRDAEALQVL